MPNRSLIVAFGSQKGWPVFASRWPWVIVLKAVARLQFEEDMVEMKPGDFINIPAFKEHRVDLDDAGGADRVAGCAVWTDHVMRPQPLIRVRDVEASSRWYQRSRV